MMSAFANAGLIATSGPKKRSDRRVTFFEAERFVGVKLDLRKLLLQRTQHSIASR